MVTPRANPPQRSVVISGFDVSSQTITLTNSDTNAADLSGMILFSMRSDALLRFPEGTMLGESESLVIGQGGDFTFKGEDKPLSKKKDNTVILYDRFGSLISKLEQ
ncbi:MAG: lamin tail domain-containing protein [Eubacteriales bacterium]